MYTRNLVILYLILLSMCKTNNDIVVKFMILQVKLKEIESKQRLKIIYNNDSGQSDQNYVT